MESKASLNEQLVYIDNMLVKSEQSGRPVNKARLALSWLAKRNRETYLELHARPKSHPLDRNPLPTIQLFQLLPNTFAGPIKSTQPPLLTRPVGTNFPRKFTLGFWWSRHGTLNTTLLRRTVQMITLGKDILPTVHLIFGFSLITKRQNSCASIMSQACGRKRAFHPPHQSYFSKDCELATSLNRGKSPSKK